MSPFEQQRRWQRQPRRRGTTNGLLTAPAHAAPTSPTAAATCPVSMTSAAVAAHSTAAAMSATPATATAAAAATMFAIMNSRKPRAPFSSRVDDISGCDHVLDSNSSHVGYAPMTAASTAATSHKPHRHLRPMRETSMIRCHTQTSTLRRCRQRHRAMHPEGCECVREGQEWGAQIACLR